MNSQKRVALNINYSDIQVGAVYTFNRKFSESEIIDFARLSGDFNPLHIDEEFAQKSRYKRNIIHGMLAGRLFSTLVGMYCPGKKCIYLSQTLQFRRPLFPQEALLVKGTIIDKSDSIKTVTIKTEILTRGQVAVSGEARVKVAEEGN